MEKILNRQFEKLSFEEREEIIENFMNENEKESFLIFDELSFEKKKIEDGDFVLISISMLHFSENFQKKQRGIFWDFDFICKPNEIQSNTDTISFSFKISSTLT